MRRSTTYPVIVDLGDGKGRRELLAREAYPKQRKKGELVDFVKVTTNGRTYILAPLGAWDHFWTYMATAAYVVRSEESSAKRAAAKRQTRKAEGKTLSTAEQGALDAWVLRSVGFKGWTPTLYVVEDFDQTASWAIWGRSDVSDSVNALYTSSKALRAAVQSSLNRLVRAGKLAVTEGLRGRKEYANYAWATGG